MFQLKRGANIYDYDVYKYGGMGFSEYNLKEILTSYLEIIEFREMIETDNENVFGKCFYGQYL